MAEPTDTKADDPSGFYRDLPRVHAFEDLLQPDRFTDLPMDWRIAVSDVVNSTGEIAAGRYKTVNMVGAAGISAVSNALGGAPFPFVFGGDGASLAVWPEAASRVEEAMAQVQSWASAEFGMTLRVAMIPVRDAVAAGHTVRLARYQVWGGADYAMFAGGGLRWAEGQMKAGRYPVPAAPPGARPDLTGLSCRWSPMPTEHGTILSVVVSPSAGADPQAVTEVLRALVTLVQRLERGGNPAPADGPGTNWPPNGATLEAHARRGQGPLATARRKALFESFVAWLLIRTGLKLGGFDARRFRRIVGQNADFRKLDDGLKMTLDCDPDTAQRIEALLRQAADRGVLSYGLAEQDEAMMTCIVPSILTDDHLHFVDGAAGGYTLAAARMKTAVSP